MGSIIRPDGPMSNMTLTSVPCAARRATAMAASAVSCQPSELFFHLVGLMLNELVVR